MVTHYTDILSKCDRHVEIDNGQIREHLLSKATVPPDSSVEDTDGVDSDDVSVSGVTESAPVGAVCPGEDRRTGVVTVNTYKQVILQSMAEICV